MYIKEKRMKMEFYVKNKTSAHDNDEEDVEEEYYLSLLEESFLDNYIQNTYL